MQNLKQGYWIMEVYKKEKPPEMTINVVKNDGFKRKNNVFSFLDR